MERRIKKKMIWRMKTLQLKVSLKDDLLIFVNNEFKLTLVEYYSYSA